MNHEFSWQYKQKANRYDHQNEIVLAVDKGTDMNNRDRVIQLQYRILTTFQDNLCRLHIRHCELKDKTGKTYRQGWFKPR